MPGIGMIEFEGVTGLVPPLTTKRVQPVENPALVPAVVRLAIGPPGRLHYQGWFETSPAASIYALVGTAVAADDEAGVTTTAMVNSVSPQIIPCLSADESTLGWWCELDVEVQAWA